MVCAGNIYAFGIWSKEFSERWSESAKINAQPTLATLYEFMLFGVYVPVGGFCFHRFGTVKTLVLAAVMNFVAYSVVLWQFFLRKERMSPNAFTFIAFFLAGNATGCTDAAVIGSNARNFDREQRGKVMGILKGYFGLAAGILALLHALGMGPTQFILLIGPLSSVVILSMVPANNAEVSLLQAEYGSLWKLRFVLSLELILAMILFLHSLEEELSWVVAAFALMIFVANFFVSPVYRILAERFLDRHFSVVNTSVDTDEESAIDGEKQSIPSLTLREALASGSFWAFFLQLSILMGGGLFVVGAIGEIALSKGGTQEDVDDLVSIISVANCAGRVFVGYIADLPNVNRALLLCISLAIMAIGQTIFALLPLKWLSVASILVGSTYGTSWTMSPTLLADLCGLEYFGQLYGFMGFSPILGSLVFSNIISTVVYEMHADDQDDCVGNTCFGFTHFSIALACIAVAVFTGPVLVAGVRSQS